MKNIGDVIVTIQYKVEISFLDALKLRVMGKRSANKLLQPYVDALKRKGVR